MKNYINAERVRSQREAELKKSGLAPDPSIAHKAEQEVNVHLPV